MGKVSLLSLGCPKNLVDSEKLLKKLKEQGIFYSSNPDESDILIINTCGFIESARKESIEEILKLSKLKGGDKKLVVFGCLAKRYGEELKREIPEIDALWGVGDDDKIVDYCSKIITRPTITGPSEKLTETPYAYLKIAEGCDKKCSYCVIPQIRGKFQSISPDRILEEAETLIQAGKKELILIAQDITEYGADRRDYNLNRLIKDIASLSGDFWIRLLYLYPTSITDELIETIASEKKVCNYVDMPLQHSEKKILELMGRGGSRSYFEKLIAKLRHIIPEVNIRTTLIAGFPQETEDEFSAMVKFVQKIKFDRLGVFTYSKEDGSAAYGLKRQIPKKIKAERFNRLMAVQSAISLEKNMQLIGKSFKALVDEADDNIAIARLYSQAPEIDGVVFIHDRDVKKGDFVNVKIEEAYDYDLKATILK
ncbi:MAG: 30S ribosomal protein S12 methylthiotransferase RimO [Nitrospira bacterium HGW-Nitrospira-1]|nr:MAG: 30S ribosomal protein S12 methylthiotransferase RimO [Nitrospira bacterium HGW-Nitrospira-1]